MQLPPEELLVRQRRLALGDEEGDGTGQGVFDDFMVLRGTKHEADGGAFVGFAISHQRLSFG
jgi:hypothetical protein